MVMTSLPPVTAVEVIESVSVCVSASVCEAYAVCHHFQTMLLMHAKMPLQQILIFLSVMSLWGVQTVITASRLQEVHQHFSIILLNEIGRKTL